MNNDDRMKLLNKHLVILREHFSSVHIIAVRPSDECPDDTVTFSIGKGSFYERFGVMREALLKQDEREKIHIRRQEEEDGDDD